MTSSGTVVNGQDRLALVWWCIALPLAMGLVGLVSSSARAQAPATDIIVEDADGVWTGVVVHSPGLIDAAENAAPKVTLEYANSILGVGLITSNLLNQAALGVPPRIIVEYGNSVVRTSLSKSDELDQVASSVGQRIVVEYANSVFGTDLQRPSFLPSTTTPTPTPTLTPTSTPIPPVNNPPNQPTLLSQFKSDRVTGIPFGGIITESAVVLKGKASDPDGDQARLQIELRRLDEYSGRFTGEPTQESVWVSSGSEARTTIYGLVSGDYHWRARTIDSNGATSPWVVQ